MTLRYLTPLTAAEQQAAGLAETWPMAIADRVRFSELDTQNHVSNRSYHDWFEAARTSYYKTYCDPAYGQAPLPRIVMHSAQVRYLEEMLADEDYIATARVTAFRHNSYSFAQEIWSQGRLRCRLAAVMVMLHPDGSGRKYPLPDRLRRAFARRDGARAET